MSALKLFVWVDPYRVSYGSSLVFAVAENVEAARQQAAKGIAYSYGLYDQDTPTVKLGAPNRVVSLPCAEWHEWSE